MRKLRTEEEKLDLIKQFKKSSLPLNRWCNNNNVPYTSMYTWLKKYDVDNTNNEETLESKTTIKNDEIKFIEINKDIVNSEQVKHKLVLKCKGFKLSINDKTDMKLLEEVLKVVTKINV